MVWRLGIDDRAVAIGAHLLSDTERARAARLRNPIDRDRFVGARALVRLALARTLGRPPGMTFETTCAHCGADHGKPRLDPPGPDFSLARRADLVVVAVAGRATVGVDVEEVAHVPAPAELAPAFAPDERAALERIAPDRRQRATAVAWTRKEAVLKATGHGLAIDPAGVAVGVRPDERPRVLRGTDAHLLELDLGIRFVGAVAVLGPMGRVRAIAARAADLT